MTAPRNAPSGVLDEAKRLSSTLRGATCRNASYWLTEGRKEKDRDTAVMNVEQAMNAYKNAAYAMADFLDKLPDTAASEKAAAPSGWIPVSERLPESGDVVAHRRDGHEEIVTAEICRTYAKHTASQFGYTHWMPLPEAPKCEHGRGITDFCEPCGRVHGG